MSDNPRHWRCREHVLALNRTLIMGIVNVTPDSFSDGGRFVEAEQAVAHGLQLIEEGADIVDIGGESTRPGSTPISVREELDRILPVIRQLGRQNRALVSVDTYKAEVAQQALAAGACIVNDISGLTFDDGMAAVIAATGAGLVLMHIKGTPRDMQRAPSYEDVIAEISGFFSRQKQKALAAGVAADQIVVDPGIGFGKRLQDNLRILAELSRLGQETPVLVGPSRKSFIGTILNLPAHERLEGTAAAVTAAILNGAAAVRVHDVRAMKRVAAIADAIRRAEPLTPL